MNLQEVVIPLVSYLLIGHNFLSKLNDHAHVCIVSDNLIPILTPLVDESLDVKNVILAYFPDNILSIEKLQKILSPRGIKCHAWELPRRQGFPEITKSIDNLVCKYQAFHLILNVTTGSRLANLAAYSVFTKFNYPIYLVDQVTDELSWLSPENMPAFQLSDTLKLNHYLQSFDFTVSSKVSFQDINKDFKSVCYDWVDSMDIIGDGIRTLNYIAFSAKNKKLQSESLSHHQLNDTGLKIILDSLIHKELISINSGCVVFSNEATRFFCNGGWLEYYVYWTILKLKKDIPEIQDISCSVEVCKEVKQHNIINELDIAFIANNKLFVVECKTKFLKPGDGNELLYKLDSLSDVLGGLHANPMLISFFKLTEKEKARALSLNIEVFDKQNLNLLQNHLFNWIKQSIVK